MAGQLYGVSNLGGYFSVPLLSKHLHYRVKPIMRFAQFVKPSDDATGLHRGTQFSFDQVSSWLQTKPSNTNRILAEDAPIPPSSFLLAKKTATLAEYGVAVPLTELVVDHNQILITPEVEKILRWDYKATMDLVFATAFKSCGYYYAPTTAAAGTFGSSTSTATANMNAFHFREIIDYMQNPLQIPPFHEDDDMYQCIMSSKALRGLYDDPDFDKVQRYAEPEKRIRGYVGTYYKCHIAETNYTDALSNGVGTNNVLGEAVFFGDDAVIYHPSVEPEIRMKVPDDYGRSQGIAWYGVFTCDPVWVYGENNGAGAVNETRVIYVTSS